MHIHIKVSLGGNVVHTGQIYFPDTLTDTVYKRTPYNRWKALDLEAREERVGLRRVDHDGHTALVVTLVLQPSERGRGS